MSSLTDSPTDRIPNKKGHAPEISSDFISELLDEINNGSGFVPFIGSGCSSASGILMGQQFDEYLACTVFLCVAEKGVIDKADDIHCERWDLRQSGWPRNPSPRLVLEARRWTRRQFDKACKASGLVAVSKREHDIDVHTIKAAEETTRDITSAINCPLLPRIIRTTDCLVSQESLKSLSTFAGGRSFLFNPTSPRDTPKDEPAIVDCAIRSLHDWRATLNFLSRLKLTDGKLKMAEEPDQAIIDRFNVYITNGRRPNLLHNMLCHLAAPARFRTILTTNFDTLIEDAFLELKERVATISVTLKGSLPDPEVVHSSNTIVKLHGSLSETRADFSLDDMPGDEDKERFFHYVRGVAPCSPEASFLPSQLLVCGYSGNENRCMEMIKYLLATKKEARVYWICHSERGRRRLEAAFDAQTYKEQIITTVTDRPDLLLLEVYQRLCLCLPGGGFSYQHTHNVAPEVYRPEHESRDAATDALVVKSKWYQKGLPDHRSKPRKLLIADGAPGVLATLRHLIRHLEQEERANALWLELEDYQNTFCVAYEICLLIAIKLGLFQLGHANLIPQELIKKLEALRIAQQSGLKGAAFCDHDLMQLWINHLQLLVDTYFNIVPNEWVVVLYGRNGPGGCVGWDDASFWGDDEYGTHVQAGRFPPFVKSLCNLGFHVIYAPYSIARRTRDNNKADFLSTLIRTDVPDALPLDEQEREYRLPHLHSPEAMEWFKRGTEFPGIEIHMQEGIDTGNSPKAVNFNTCMPTLWNEWVCQHRDGSEIESKNGKHPEYLKRLRFLYTATLFRQSRVSGDLKVG